MSGNQGNKIQIIVTLITVIGTIIVALIPVISDFITSRNPQEKPPTSPGSSSPTSPGSSSPTSPGSSSPTSPGSSVTAQAPSLPPVSTPQPETENQNESAGNVARNSIPGFPIGTSESSIKAALGNPTKTFRGYFPNTRALHYELPNQVTLGYLFDQNSRQIRITEAAFAQSVEPEVMQATLQGMLGGSASSDINQGLQQVYQRRANQYSFNTGVLKGVIERNDRERIYIGVWDADLN